MKTRIRMTTCAAAFGLACVALWFATSTTSAQQANKKPSADASQKTPEVDGDEDQDPSEQRSFWMNQKLRRSKEVLTGLAMADFEAIGKNAEIMQGLNRVEAFVRGGTEGYRDQLRQFNMANKALIRASQDENLDGATLAFNQLTISCVNCHKHLRETESESE